MVKLTLIWRDERGTEIGRHSATSPQPGVRYAIPLQAQSLEIEIEFEVVPGPDGDTGAAAFVAEQLATDPELAASIRKRLTGY